MSAKNQHLGADQPIGLGPEVSDLAYKPFLKNESWFVPHPGFIIEKDSEDAGNTGKETTLRPGMILVRVETGGNKNKFVPVDHSDAPVAASVVQAVILNKEVNMLGRDGAVADKHGSGIIGGVIDENAIILVDALYIEEVKAALPLCHFMKPAV
jgi:hypothetical protein